MDNGKRRVELSDQLKNAVIIDESISTAISGLTYFTVDLFDRSHQTKRLSEVLST